MAYCWKCGKPLPEGAKFCIYCGAEVKTVEPDEQETTGITTEENKEPAEKQGLYYNPKPAEKQPAAEPDSKPAETKKTTRKKKTQSEETQDLYYDPDAMKTEEKKTEYKLPEETETKPQKTRKTARKKETSPDIVEEKAEKRKKAEEKTERKSPAKKRETKAEKARREEEEREALKEAKKAAKAEKKAARKARKREKKALKKQKKKRSFFGKILRFIRNLFIFSLCANLIIVGLFYSGILTEDFDIITAYRQLMNKVEDLKVTYNEPVDELDIDDPGLITIRYSDRELKNATGAEAEVTKDNHVVAVGGLTVDMGIGNLEKNDTLIIKDLGRKDDDNMMMALHCYDLSLKSGTDQFPGLVRITMPLELGEMEYLDGMVYFNEQTKQWEDLLYEVSADGKTVTAYMDHFTKVSPKIGKMTAQMFEAALAANSDKRHSLTYIKSKDGDTSIPANLFVEAWNKIRRTEEMDYVYFRAYPTMRNVALHKDTLKDLFALSGRDITGTPESIHEAIIKLKFAVDAKDMNWPARVLGVGDSSVAIVNEYSALNSLLSTGGKSFFEYSGKMLAGLNIMLTALKVYSECRAGKDVGEAVADNDIAIVSSALSAVGLICATVGGLATWPLTLAGIGLCALSVSLDVYKYTEGLDEMSMQEQAYFAYYTYKANDTTKIPDETRIGFDKENFKCKMEIPTGVAVNEKDSSYKRIVDHVKKYGLNEEWVWNSMLRLIFKNCETVEDAKNVNKYVDDMLYKYADAYWNLSKQERDSWVYRWMNDKGYSEEEIQAALDEVVLNSDIETYRKDMMNRTLLQLEPMIEQQVNLYTTKAYAAFRKEVQKEFINPLNQTIYFLVEDKTLQKGQTFADSVYAQDYRQVVFNQEHYFKNIEFSSKKHITDYYPQMRNELPIYSEVIAPIRFVDVEYPLFYPYQVTWEGQNFYMDRVKTLDRYPHEPEYLPWVDTSQKNENLVFACNVYHYMQMGQPTRVVFRDVTAIETWEDAQRYYEDPGVEVSFTIPKFNKKGQSYVRLKVTGDGELSQLNGYWEGPWLGSSKQWYYFEVNTENKKIYIEDTLGLPTESFTITRYKYDNRTKTLKFVIGWGKERATMEYKMTGKDTMVLYIEYNGDHTSLEFVRSTRERFDDWGNRQKFNLPDPSLIIPEGDET
ncbi:MAG: zinc-ribbon domain-containing protein [Erysipelotrichaceae bacterium]|nr:zinc-ribbon domain-containing protein [Erysipelotrichaceae bacterium]